MTAAEWGRAQPSAPPARSAPASTVSAFTLIEYGAAVLLLLLLGQALLGPLFNPAQDPDGAGWLRTMWLPIYGIILALAAVRVRMLANVAWGAALIAPLLLLAFVSSEWSVLPDVTVRRAVALGFTTLFGLWLAARFSWRELIGLIAASCIVLAVGSYLAAIVAPEFAIHSTIHPGAWRGLWYEKNSMGATMVIGALACGCAAVTGSNRLIWLGGAVLCAGLVLLSTSTTSLLALVLAGGGFLGLAAFRRGGAVSVATSWAALVAVGAVAALFVFAPEFVFDLLGKDATLTGRTDIWGAVLRQVEARPVLGYGFGAFWEDVGGPVGYVRAEVDWLAPTAHNGWLELLLSFGWTGVALFGLHLLVTAAAAVHSIWRGPESYWAVLFLALFVLFSLSESTIMQQNNLSWALYVMTGAKLVSRRAVAITEPPTASTASVRARPAPTGAAWSPEAAVASEGTSRISFFLGVGALLILSRTWLPIAFGGPAPGQVGGEMQIVYIFAYLAAGMLAFSRLGSTVGLAVRAPFLIALLALAGVSALWSIAPQDTLLSVIALLGSTLVGLAIAARFSWRDLAEVLATTFAVIVVGSIGAALLAPDVGRMEMYDGAWRGLFNHKNALGAAVAAAVPIFAAAALYSPPRRWLWTAFAVLAGLVLILSASTTALLATVLSMLALGIALAVRRGGAGAVFAAYALVVTPLVLGLVLILGGDGLLDLFGKDATLTGRTGIWAAAMRQIEERPWLGFGYSSLWNDRAPDPATAWMFREARHEAEHAHNSWLEIWLGLGFGGVILFSLMILKAWTATAASVVRRHGAALLAAPFVLGYSLTAVSETAALTYNDLRWVVFVAIAAKLGRWGQDPLASASEAPAAERLTSA